MSAQGNGDTEQPSKSSRIAAWIDHVVIALLGVLLIAGLSLAMVVPQLSGGVHLEVGEVSPVTIRAPRSITFESKIRTERARQQAANAVDPVYDPADPRVAQQQIRRAATVLDYIDTVRHDPYASPEEKRVWINQVPELDLSAEVIDDLLSLDDPSWQIVRSETLAVLSQIMRQPIREDRDVLKARRMLPNTVDPTLPEKQARVVRNLAAVFIQPNSFFNPERTAAERQAAREAVPPQMVTYEKGEVIVREGERVKPEHLEALEALGLLRQGIQWSEVAGVTLFMTVVTLVLGFYLRRLNPELWKDRRQPALGVLIVLAFAALARMMVPGQPLLAFLFPAAAAPLLLSALVGPHLALGATLLLSLLIGFLGGGSLELMTYVLVGGIVATLAIWRMERLNAFLWAGSFIALANLVLMLAFELQSMDYTLQSLLIQGGLAVANAVLVTSLAIAGFYALGALFGITTSLQLMELARPTHPLLHQLQLKAPGTYHHSLIVSNMAEQAAQEINADALLVRVGAYYHDIGKMLRPYFFIENQVEGANVHDRLDPETSAQIIISHVPDGLELAKKYNLPRILRDFISQHHGTTRVGYFYRKACEERGAENVDEARFRYPGPKPQSRETAIVMLADSVEATVRANRPATVDEIRTTVRQIITRRLTEGELDACDLTLRDLDKIATAFVRILKATYHPRVKYPEEAQPAPAVAEQEAVAEV
jgi:hypothetical protein